MPGIKPRHFIRDMKNSICAILILTEKIDFDIHSLSKLGLLLHKMSFVKTAVPMTVKWQNNKHVPDPIMVTLVTWQK